MDATALTDDTQAHQEQEMAAVIAAQNDAFRRNIALPGETDVPEGRVVITCGVEKQGPAFDTGSVPMRRLIRSTHVAS